MTASADALAIYQEYEDLVRAAGSQLADQFAPPHPDPVGAFSTAFPGLDLPDELATWWAWHDGITQSLGIGAPIGGSNMLFRSMAQTIDLRRMELDIAEEAAEPPDITAELIWPHTWIPVLATQDSTFAIELAPRGRGTVLFRDGREMGRNAPTAAQSWPVVVQWWSTLLRIGATRWDATALRHGRWVTDEKMVPDELKGNPLAYSPHPSRYAPQFHPLFPY
ncbi:SMI1/KNR4 family protein [Cellulomonas fengjieae]|uniref:SMI1/KNR4 family protein n=1 Tax=Cellulomonas fengjieae TaxID=2819978 RepID=A0ABS3SJY0_9CELL|nr:SMI1/KNR4 family protein [Cellulomonas fengjieae]MBO3085967.1 SMI1/KNR4 family protein [Cellulomonas fengjieae]QVI65962.1 SMI1/KNR4 family protein [Cellulomonas fengjieae]